MAKKALAERGYISERKNYSRIMLCLMQNELVFCKRRTDSSADITIKLISVVNITADLSEIPCYNYQIDPLYNEGNTSGGMIGSIMRKASSVFATNIADLKTGVGGQNIDNYDVVLELISGDIISLR